MFVHCLKSHSKEDVDTVLTPATLPLKHETVSRERFRSHERPEAHLSLCFSDHEVGWFLKQKNL